jgi:L-ascorbate metabolism protein UlaG (beta-lactamase superfamily)
MEYTRRKSRFVIKGHSAGDGFTDLMKWQIGGGRAKWPRKVENGSYAGPPPYVYGSDLCVTWIGHSTVLVQFAGLNILTDPLFSKRASPLQFVGPKRVRPPALKVDELPPIDLVLVSHNHYDHLDVPGLRQLLGHHSPMFITLLGNHRYLKRVKRSIDCIELDWRTSQNIGTAIITAMPALHWSKRSFDDTNHALWGSFVISSEHGSIYFAGDTGYGDGAIFREVRDRFGPPRLSLLPIGAYEPRWFMKSQHMNPEEAVLAHLDLDSRKSLGIHHGTVQLTNEAIDLPVSDLRRALSERNIPQEDFVTPDAGETLWVA